MVSETLRKQMRIAGFIPVFVLTSLVSILVITGYRASVFEPQDLALVLHFTLVFSVSIMLAFVSSRAFLKSGSSIILLIGIAAVINGVLLLIAQWGLTPGLGVTLTPNEAVIIANIGFLLTSLIILASGLLLIMPQLNLGFHSSRKVALGTFYGGAILLVVIVIFSSISGFFPPFFTDNGPTNLRQVVLGITTLFIVISCVLYGRAYFRARSPILYWYTLGLVSFEISQLGTIFTIKIGDPINWCGRLGLYLTGFFFIMAVLAPNSGQGLEAGVSNRWASAFRNDREKLASLFANMRNGVLYGKLVMDDNGKPIDLIYLDMNAAYETVIGGKKENFLGKRATEALPNLLDRLPNWIDPYAQAAIKEETVYYERPWPYSGKWYYITIYSPEKGYFVAINEDITERKKAEEKLKESEERFRTLADNVPQLEWMADATGFIYWYNKQWYDYTGTTPEQMEGWGWQSVHDPEALPKVLEKWKSSIATGQPFDMVFPLRGSDGVFRPFLTRITPVMDDRGRVVRWFGTNTEITEQLEMQQKLQRSNLELQQFAYLASHDLQEPLRMVISYLSLLDKKYKDELDIQAREYIDHAVDGGVRMRRLIDDLLAYSRVETKVKEFALVDMKEVVEGTIKVLKTSIDESKADIYIEPMPTVMADGLQMQQVMQNLIANAVKFHGQERPRVHISAIDGRKEWTFLVKDNGIGLKMEYAERIFQMFQRLHNQDQYPGTGVGLAIVKKIVDRHGGRIWVESEEGKGSTFFFTIPKVGG
jgi:PAS domain S-box-containing protein